MGSKYIMKFWFMTELSVMTVVTLLCIIRAIRSRNEMAGPVAYFLASIIVPLLGNIVLCMSENPVICNAGYLLYLMGTNLVIFTLNDFSRQYCGFGPLRPLYRNIIVAVLTADSISVFLNIIFVHCYTLEETVLESGEIYYVLNSRLGHKIHLAISAIILLMIAGLFVRKIHSCAVLYLERYLVILLSIIIVVVWEYYNVLMERTIDRSMVGLALGGVLVCFFAIDYRPVFLKMTLHDLLISNMSDAVLFFDADGRPFYSNKAAASMFGITKVNLPSGAKILGESITGREFIENGMRAEESFRKQVEINENGVIKYYDVDCQRMEDKKGNYLGSFFGISDNTEVQRENRDSLFRQTHDVMTGMLNKETFIDKVRIKMIQEPEEEFVMILSDISDFKIINDVYGREKADSILLGIARNIRKLVHEGTIYCRWGGDQFAAFAKKNSVTPQLLEEEIRSFMNNRSDLKFPVAVHAGYYVVTEKELAVPAMIDRCVMAISAVHDNFQQVVGVYDDKLRQERLWERRINAELPAALSGSQIFPYLQPQYDSNNVLTGAEVLVRWKHPTEGLLAPYRFIPIFEKNGMIVRVDMHIWEEACKILASWKGTEKKKLHLSVNISPKDFYFIDIFETFTKLVEKYDIDVKKLHLEVTETVVINDTLENIQTINRLREYGFIVEMDDFGSGYSSLNLLRDMPVDVLKIDMAFLGRTTYPKKAELILNNIINLAHQLDMLSIAEGVELEDQLTMLKDMGCNIFQGYYFARPMPLEEFEKLAA